MPRTTEIRLTELDAARLERALIEQMRREDAEAHGTVELEDILDRAAVVPASAIDPQVVTMNSTAVLEDRASGNLLTVTLVYPSQADTERSRISVLSPVGRALVGSRVGDVIEVTVPNHPPREFLVRDLPFQPEAHGRFDL